LRFGGNLDLGIGVLAGSTAPATAVAALDPANGSTQWNTAFRATAGGNVEPLGIGVDASGAMTLTGRFSGSVDFGGGARTSAGGDDAYAVQLSPTGSWVFDFAWGGAMADQAIATATSSVVAVAGLYRGTASFAGGMLTATGPTDGILAGLAANGTVSWSVPWAGSSADAIVGITTMSSGDLAAIGGVFPGTVDFGGGVRTITGNVACAIVGYQSSGAYAWERLHGDGNGSCIGTGIGAGRCGRVAVVGQFQGMLDFGGGVRTHTGTSGGFALLLERP
jgi:hypothetical protein